MLETGKQVVNKERERERERESERERGFVLKILIFNTEFIIVAFVKDNATMSLIGDFKNHALYIA